MSASGSLGHVLKILHTPEVVANLCFGGTKRNRHAAISGVRYSESIHNERPVHPLRLVGGDGTISGISL